MQTTEFLSLNPVFTTEQFQGFQDQRGSRNPWTQKNLLAHYEQRNRILRIRRGVYAVVPSGSEPGNAPVDPYLIAAMLTPDAVLAYHTALSFHGRAHSLSEQFTFLTATAARRFNFRSWQFRPIQFPASLRRAGKESLGVLESERAGLAVKVTSLERTLVDMLDHPDLGGGWEEIWRSLGSVEYYDLDQVIEYAKALGNATTAAKVGLFLEQHRESLMVEESHLNRLAKLRPKAPHYLERGAKGDHKLDSRWNLVVPNALIEQAWEQVL